MEAQPEPSRGRQLPALALLLATAAALLAVALVDEAPPAGDDPQLSDPAAIAEHSLELVPIVAQRVEAMRELSFDEVPLPRVVSSDFLGELVEDEFRRREGDPAEAVGTDAAIARIVGLLASDENLLGLIEASGDLAAAAWDTREERLYVVADAIGESPALLEMFLAHELTHAIEDQRFGLPDADPDDGDRAMARAALVEGTATAVMIEYAARYLDPLALGAAALGLDADAEALPSYAVEQMEWVYLGGARFVERLFEIGDGWELIDEALERRPPVSTAQVLDPQRYVRDVRPVEVEIDPAPLDARNWELAEEGTVGEFATRQLLAVGLSPANARGAARGWAGDRFELWRRDVAPHECQHPCRGELSLVIRWRWESSAATDDFAAAIRSYVEDGLDGEAVGADAWRVEDGWVALEREPLETGLAFAPERELAEAAAGR